MSVKLRDTNKIGYTHIRAMNRIYEVQGYARRPAPKSSKQSERIDIGIIELRQRWKLASEEWVEVEMPLIERNIDQEWRLWHEHVFHKGSLEECMAAGLKLVGHEE